jgi:hypothetical protein
VLRRSLSIDTKLPRSLIRSDFSNPICDLLLQFSRQRGSTNPRPFALAPRHGTRPATCARLSSSSAWRSASVRTNCSESCEDADAVDALINHAVKHAAHAVEVEVTVVTERHRRERENSTVVFGLCHSGPWLHNIRDVGWRLDSEARNLWERLTMAGV